MNARSHWKHAMQYKTIALTKMKLFLINPLLDNILVKFDGEEDYVHLHKTPKGPFQMRLVITITSA